MLSTIVIALSLGMMLPIFVNLIIGALHEGRRQMHTETTHSQVQLAPHHRYSMATPVMQNAMKARISKQAPQPAFTLPSSWYTRNRTLVSLSFLLMLLLTLFVQSGLAGGALKQLSKGFSLFGDSSSSSDIHTVAHTIQVNASQELVRISQLDPGQYSSSDEYNTWAYSACSAAAMTEVFNAYGRHFRVTDVLQVEARIGEITPELGLVRAEGVEHTAAQFGFKTVWGNAWTLQQVADNANQGKPVIISFPPDRYAGGHILDVIGVRDGYVYLADTSLWNRRSITIAQFLYWWEGFAAVVRPA